MAQKRGKAGRKEYSGLAYIKTRELYLNSIGIFRCELYNQGEKECLRQCEECSLIYVDRSIK